MAPVGGLGVAVGAAALSTGLGVAGEILEGELAGQVAAVDIGYEAGSYLGGAAIGGWDWT